MRRRGTLIAVEKGGARAQLVKSSGNKPKLVSEKPIWGRRPVAASTKGAGLRSPPFVEPCVDGYEAIRFFGYEDICLLVAH